MMPRGPAVMTRPKPPPPFLRAPDNADKVSERPPTAVESAALMCRHEMAKQGSLIGLMAQFSATEKPYKRSDRIG